MIIYLSERDKEEIQKLQEAKIWVYYIRDGITVEGCGKKVVAWDTINDKECVIKNLPK